MRTEIEKSFEDSYYQILRDNRMMKEIKSHKLEIKVDGKILFSKVLHNLIIKQKRGYKKYPDIYGVCLCIVPTGENTLEIKGFKKEEKK